VPTINAWVNEQTQGKIENIITAIPDNVVMYLINAIYFKGDWMQQFDKKLTAPLPFHLQDGSTVNVPTMTYGTEAAIRQTWTPTARIIELPYGGGAFSMTIVLPREDLTVDSVLSVLTLDDWNSWIAALDTTSAELYSPNSSSKTASHSCIRSPVSEWCRVLRFRRLQQDQSSRRIDDHGRTT